VTPLRSRHSEVSEKKGPENRKGGIRISKGDTDEQEGSKVVGARFQAQGGQLAARQSLAEGQKSRRS